MLFIDKLNSETAVILNNIILNDGIILWPSGGVYGLACDATSKTAVEKIYSIKNRDYDKPLSIIANKNTAHLFGHLTAASSRIVHSLWPDFIGIIVKKKSIVKDFVTCCKPTVGLVCSSFYNEFLADKIIKPLASTSANLSGENEIACYQTAAKLFNDSVDAIIVSTKNNSALNTLIAFDENDNYTIVRQGKYSLNEIRKKIEFNY